MVARIKQGLNSGEAVDRGIPPIPSQPVGQILKTGVQGTKIAVIGQKIQRDILNALRGRADGTGPRSGVIRFARPVGLRGDDARSALMDRRCQLTGVGITNLKERVEDR